MNVLRLGLIALGLFLTAKAPAARAEETLIFCTATGPAKATKTHVKLTSPLELPQVKLNPRRGTIVVRLTVLKPFALGFGSHLQASGLPRMALRCFAERPKQKPGEKSKLDPTLLRAGVAIDLGLLPDESPLERIEAAATVKPGADLHVAWTWSGLKHSVFLNGKMVTTRVAASPFPRVTSPALLLLYALAPEVLEAGPVYEIAVYDFPFTEGEAARDFAEKDKQPFHARQPHGPSAVAQWAPGEHKAHVSVDTGCALLHKAKRAEVILHRSEKRLGAKDIELGPDGFAEMLLPVTDMLSGTYHAEVVLRDKTGNELAKVQSDPWELPKTTWLGNRKGVSDKIQPPWRPVGVKGLTLTVWGREYELAGGFGLPQQITSQGHKLLSQPVALELVQDGRALPLKNASVEITRREPHFATWTGRAEAGQVRVQVEGRLEYDGMMLLTLRLEPRVPGSPVKLDGLKLHTTLPRERALFLNTATDQGFWWYPYRSWLPDERGGPISGPQTTEARRSDKRGAKPMVLFDNRKQKPLKTSFLFFVLLCDHDVGLEWFADGLGGWQVDESKTVQELVREVNGDVRLTCLLANRAFELAKPITITFGYDATPIKPLPADWRSAYVNHHPLQGVRSQMALWWLWDGPYSKARGSLFALRPNDLAAYAKAIGRVPGIRYAPFTNQHVLIPSGPDNKRPKEGWPWFNNLLQAETDNDGWKAVPTRGARDYWASSIDQWLKSGGMDALYVDEANVQTVSARLLTGSGYVRPDGSHGIGHNTLAMREQLKRVRQLLIDNGKRPVVWVPVYAMIIPHAHAFADVVSEGEAFMFEKPGSPDWIDQWGDGLLERRGGPGAKGGPWLLALGPAQKFGFVPIFLNYIKFHSDPSFVKALRGQYGLLGLLDIIPMEAAAGWFYKAKHDFGVASPKTTFHRFFEQQAIRTDRGDVPVSYYRKDGAVLAIVTNLGKETYAGPVKFDRKALGWSAGKLAVAWIDGQKSGEYNTALKITPLPVAADGSSVQVRIPSHDFVMIRAAGAGAVKSAK